MRRFLTLALTTALLTALAAPAMAQRPDFSQKSDATIVDLAVGNDNFDVLVAALVNTGAVGLFDGSNDYTVFAPTDAAFETLFSADEATIVGLLEGDGLTEEDYEALLDTVTGILTYHVSEGVRNSRSVTGAGFVEMLNGQRITVGADGIGDSTDDSANLVPGLFDLRVADGIVHVIDKVLIPAS